MLKAVIFDLDDTLIDWSGFNADWATLEIRHLERVVNYIRSQGYRLPDVAAYAQEFRMRTAAAWTDARVTLRAPNLGTILVETAAHFGVPREALDIRCCLEAYEWGAVEGTQPFPEVPTVMEALHRAGMRVGIVTNAFQPMWLRDREMEMHGLLHYFPECRISAADFGYLKPHPTIFEHALNILGTQPEETVFVGDNPVADIVGAQSAGLQAVLRLTNHSEREVTATPDAVIRDLSELLPVLDAWHPGWRSGT